MKYIKKIVLLSVFSALFAGLVAAEDSLRPATEVIKETAESVIANVNENRAELESNPDALYGLVNEMVIPHFDFVSMSKWVLGKKNWTGATESQQKDFVEQFKTLLVNTYIKALLQYSNNKINYLEEKPTKNGKLVEVKTEIEVSGSNPVPINYRMHSKNGKWQVVDVVVNGASLVRTYRGEFTSQIRNHDLQYLIDKLKERNK